MVPYGIVEALESIDRHVENWWTESPKLGPLLSSSSVFEPIDYIIHVERFSPPSAIQIIQLFHVLLDLEVQKERNKWKSLADAKQALTCCRLGCWFSWNHFCSLGSSSSGSKLVRIRVFWANCACRGDGIPSGSLRGALIRDRGPGKGGDSPGDNCADTQASNFTRSSSLGSGTCCSVALSRQRFDKVSCGRNFLNFIYYSTWLGKNDKVTCFPSFS